MDYFFQAFVIGLLLSLMIGPVFFLLLEISITRGFKSAIIFDLGVILSDLFYVFISLFFAYQLKAIGSLKNNLLLSVIGGGLFLAYGIYNLWFKKIKITAEETLSSENMELEEDTTLLEIKRQKKDNLWLFLKGFTLNLLNPGVVIYWLAIVAKGFDLVENHDGYGHIYVFIGIVLTVFFGFDCLKAYLANKLKPLVTVKLLKALNITIGVAFLSTGVFLIVRQLFKL
ncbi:MAG: LysE family translocator [Flavobacteriia bacterium]|nr:LysE family translocator [Flavobacteriia bacterium]